MEKKEKNNELEDLKERLNNENFETYFYIYQTFYKTSSFSYKKCQRIMNKES